MAEVGAALPSWNDGPAKAAIVDFVARVTKPGGPDFVPAPARIATFDNDGTLWCEQPLQVQVFFPLDRLKELAATDPTMKDRQPFKAFLEHDLKTIHELGKQAVFELFFATHAGMTQDEFDRAAQAWLASARHPSLVGSSRNASTSRSSSCSTTFAPTASRRSSSRAAGSI